jgi:hypothetical protein
MKRLFLFLTALTLSLGAFANPSFDDPATQARLARFFIHKSHPMKPVLDKIFSGPGVLASEEAFKEAGFKILLSKRSSNTRKAYFHLGRHPLVPGYLFKVYLDSEDNLESEEGWRKLADRCQGAENIRKLIKKKGIRNFVVPDKWLYRVPVYRKNQQRVVLMVTDMNLTSSARCRKAWRNASKKQLDELYCILSRGYSSTSLINNISYTKMGKFTCLDTEYPGQHPKRLTNMPKAKRFFSPEMSAYWDFLMMRHPLTLK